MEITQVKIFPVQEDKLKAFVSVVFDHCFMVNDIKVIQGKDGLFLSMPSRRKKSGEFKDVAHPLNNETRRMFEERVLAEYRLEVDDVTPRRPDRELDDEPLASVPASDSFEPSRPASQPAAPQMPAPQMPAPRPAPCPSSPPPDARQPVTPPPVAASEKTLEEVQELHLSDSFSSVS